MPPLNDKLNDGSNLRLLLYGPQKMKKTWWASKFAEAGFNVVLVDSDDGTQILKQIDPSARHRISIINTKDDFNRACAYLFLTEFLKGKPMVWDDTARSVAYNISGVNPLHAHYALDVSKFDKHTVLILDSWTAIVYSTILSFAKSNLIDLSDAAKPDWDGYRWCGSAADFILIKLKTLQCQTALIGHQTVYEKRSTEMVGDKAVQKVEWSRTQLISTSGPHSMKIGKDFTDILYFNMRGSQFRIDTTPETTRDGGCRNIPPKVWDWSLLTPKKVCELANIALPPSDLPPTNGLTYFPPGVPVEADFLPKTKAKNVALNAGAAAVKKPAGLSGLLGKPKS